MHSQAIKMLYAEHQVILERIEDLRQLLKGNNMATKKEELLRYVDFFRTYADKYHHHKEEDVLFSLLKDRFPGLWSITEALEEHHAMFRENIADIENALRSEDWEKVEGILPRYLSDLTDHISAEDDELFVAVDEQLTGAEREKLYYAFLDKDRELGEEAKLEYENQARPTF
ncbi:MAG: hemerythrin domain-containing protein [Saprospiraceae bacterium]